MKAEWLVWPRPDPGQEFEAVVRRVTDSLLILVPKDIDHLYNTKTEVHVDPWDPDARQTFVGQTFKVEWSTLIGLDCQDPALIGCYASPLMP